VIYPDFDNFEVKNETGEWRKHFYFTLEECKLEDFQETVRTLPLNAQEYGILVSVLLYLVLKIST